MLDMKVRQHDALKLMQTVWRDGGDDDEACGEEEKELEEEDDESLGLHNNERLDLELHGCPILDALKLDSIRLELKMMKLIDRICSRQIEMAERVTMDMSS